MAAPALFTGAIDGVRLTLRSQRLKDAAAIPPARFGRPVIAHSGARKFAAFAVSLGERPAVAELYPHTDLVWNAHAGWAGFIFGNRKPFDNRFVAFLVEQARAQLAAQLVEGGGRCADSFDGSRVVVPRKNAPSVPIWNKCRRLIKTTTVTIIRVRRGGGSCS